MKPGMKPGMKPHAARLRRSMGMKPGMKPSMKPHAARLRRFCFALHQLGRMSNGFVLLVATRSGLGIWFKCHVMQESVTKVMHIKKQVGQGGGWGRGGRRVWNCCALVLLPLASVCALVSAAAAAWEYEPKVSVLCSAWVAWRGRAVRTGRKKTQRKRKNPKPHTTRRESTPHAESDFVGAVVQ